LGTVEAVIDLLHPFPGLLLEWNIFLPEGWAVHSSPDPEDSHTSIVNAKTPSGDMTLQKSVPLDLYPLLPPNEREEPAPIFTLLNDVKTHYVENPKIYKQLLKIVQPRPDVDNVCLTSILDMHV
jgi:histone deacetylase complex regulatory component SIN3